MRLPRDWGTAVIWGLWVYLLGYFVWQVTGWGGERYETALADLLYLVPGPVSALLALRASGHPALSVRMRWTWRVFALAFMMSWLGDAIWAYNELVVHREPFPSWGDAAYLASYPALLVALLLIPIIPRSRAETARFWLDIGVVLVAGWMTVWYFIIEPTAGSGAGPLETAIVLAYPLCDFIVLFGIVAVLLRRPREGARQAMWPLLVGLALYTVGDLVYTYLALQESYVSGAWVDAVYFGALCLMALSAHEQYRHADAPPPVLSTPVVHRTVNLLPYAAVAAGYALLLSIGLTYDDVRLTGLLVGAVALTGLVVARQIAVLLDNSRLLAQSVALTEQIGREEARFRSLVQHAWDVIAVADAAGRLDYVSDSCRRVLGYDPRGLAGVPVFAAVHPDDRARARSFYRAVLVEPGATQAIELRVRAAGGVWRECEAALTNMLGNPSVGGVVVNLSDVTGRKVLERELVFQASHDVLTQLPNRELFLERLRHALDRGARNGHTSAVLFVDLDHFKAINGSLGHAAGDELLVTVAERVQGCLRAADTAARFGGDEFVVLLEDIASPDAALDVARRILARFQTSVDLGGQPVMVSLSVGVAVSTPGRTSPDELLQQADTAMYLAKHRGRACYELYDEHADPVLLSAGRSGDVQQAQSGPSRAVDRQAAG